MPPENRRRRKREVRDPTANMNEVERKAYLTKVKLNTPIAEMQLPVRIVNALEDDGMLLASDLVVRKREQITGIKNFGEKTLREIIAAVKELGLDPPSDWLAPKRKQKKPRGAPKDPGLLGFGW